jgi:hypothetical protein
MITGPPAAVEAHQLCAFLNFWAGDKPLWVVKQAAKSHADEFTVGVAAGEYYLVLPGGHHDERRLSLRSARIMWEIILTDNGGEPTFLAHLAELEAQRQAAQSAASAKVAQMIGA